MLDAKTRGWVLVETDDLRVRSDAPPRRAIELAAHYQRMHDAIAEYELPCGFDRLTAPLEVTLFEQHGVESYHRPPQTNLLGLQAQIVVHTVERSHSLGMFTHELTHRLLAVCFPTATIWLHEGMASFYETARLHEDTLELGFPPYVFLPASSWSGPPHIYQDEINGDRVTVVPDSVVPGADELRGMKQAELYGTDQGSKLINYAGAWALVHLLKVGDLSLSPAFKRYLEALNLGTEEEVAWQLSFAGLGIPQRYEAYLLKHPYARVRSMHVPEPEGLEARPMSRGEAALMLAQLETWTEKQGAKRAAAYIDFAAEQDSTRLSALLLQGALRKTLDDGLGALRSMQEALALSSTNPDALAAMLHLEMSENAMTLGISVQLGTWLGALKRNATSSYHFAVAAWWETYVVGDVPVGLALAERAVELDGTNFMAYVNVADGAAALGQLDRALGAYSAARALSLYQAADARHYLEKRLAEVRRRLEGPQMKGD